MLFLVQRKTSSQWCKEIKQCKPWKTGLDLIYLRENQIKQGRIFLLFYDRGGLGEGEVRKMGVTKIRVHIYKISWQCD